MAITPEEAVASLRDVERTQGRSATFRSYRISAPHFILWGVLWMIGYTASDLAPHFATWAWLGILAIGAVTGYLLVRQARQQSGEDRALIGWRFFGTFATISALVVLTAVIMRPQGQEIAAFIPLLMAALYVIRGLWSGWRYSAIGIGLAALSLGGFFFLHHYFLLWMALVGGGTLILTGLWLHRA